MSGAFLNEATVANRVGDGIYPVKRIPARVVTVALQTE